MPKISQSICLIVCLVSVATICMARTVVNQAEADDHLHHLIKKRQDTYCFTATVHDYACRANHCHNTTTHIHDCAAYSLDNDCANFTSRVDICNTTDCRNTTSRTDVCIHDLAQNCANADISYHGCTNGACQNRTTTIHACDTNVNAASAAACAAAGDDNEATVRAVIHANCIDRLVTFLTHVFGK